MHEFCIMSSVTLKNYRCDSAVLSGFVLMFLASIMWMKLVSYAHTNYDIRVLSKSTEKVIC
jgi:diacylglycerol O-acyltransferase-1